MHNTKFLVWFFPACDQFSLIAGALSVMCGLAKRSPTLANAKSLRTLDDTVTNCYFFPDLLGAYQALSMARSTNGVCHA